MLVLLKVPPEPQPPMGDPASLRVFHAGRNYFRLRLAGWAAAQVLALAGILFWTAMLFEIETIVWAEAAAPIGEATSPVTSTEPVDSERPPNASAATDRRAQNPGERFANRIKLIAASAERAAAAAEKEGRAKAWAGYKQMLVEIGLLLPNWAYPLIWALKIFSFIAYLVQIPITYAVRRLDYEMRWYMVTDRSLRLRHGVWKVSESTMSFANLQQVTVTQGPIQGLLGMADVKVQSAGGGGRGDEHQLHSDKDMHLGVFHCVTNANEIRDLILERLRRFRDTGLGDPDEATAAAESPTRMASHASPSIAPTPGAADTLLAARALLAEARALRMTLS